MLIESRPKVGYQKVNFQLHAKLIVGIKFNV